MRLSTLQEIEKGIRERFGTAMFTTTELHHVFGRSDSWAYMTTKRLQEIGVIKLVQTGTMNWFNIWRVK